MMAVMTPAREREAEQSVDAGGGVVVSPGADAAGDQDEGCGSDGDGRQNEVAADGAERCAAPREQRADGGEEDECEADGNHDAVEVGRAHGDFGAVVKLREDGEKRAPEDGEAGEQEDEVVEEENGFAGDEGFEFVFGAQVVALQEEGEKADGEDDDEEGGEPVADGALREGVDGGDDAGTRQAACRGSKA